MRLERPSSCRGGLTPNLTRAVVIASLLLVLPQFGCTSHSDRRVQAERRWNQVRARIKYDLASQQFERGRTETAIETVSEAIAADPSSADQFLLLAHCNLEQGKLVSARKAAEQAKRCAPDMADIDYTLGVIAERSEQWEAALEHYRRARSQDENVVDYVVAEAECLAVAGRLEEAIALVTANIQRFDSDGTLETLLAEICLLTGDKETALNGLSLAIERSGCQPGRTEGRGGCTTLIEEYGRLLSETGRHAQAVALLHPYVEARSDAPPSVVTALCVGYLETGRTSEARRLLREEVKRRPDHAKGWMLLARASVMTDDWTTARRCADQLERLVPHSSHAHLLRGFVCWRQDDLPAAVDSLQRALAIDPDDALAHCLIGQVLEDLGRPPAATKAHYERALQIDPQFAWATHLRGSPGTCPIRRPIEAGDAWDVSQTTDGGESLP
ncbi:MAG: tetratricopeptide repeat protein [Planctomycetes bacterium]|nr:tetratricopeptide repeat protein [Planctomycetota bacterium]